AVAPGPGVAPGCLVAFGPGVAPGRAVAFGPAVAIGRVVASGYAVTAGPAVAFWRAVGLGRAGRRGYAVRSGTPGPEGGLRQPGGDDDLPGRPRGPQPGQVVRAGQVVQDQRPGPAGVREPGDEA